MNENIKSIMAAEKAALDVVRSEVVDLTLRTAARVRARLAAYDRIYSNYERFIERRAEELAAGLFAGSSQELGVAKLVAQWLVESEQFLQEVQPVIENTDQQLKRSFLEQSFETLPAEMREEVMLEFNQRKQELLMWLVKRIQQARSKAQHLTTETTKSEPK